MRHPVLHYFHCLVSHKGENIPYDARLQFLIRRLLYNGTYCWWLRKMSLFEQNYSHKEAEFWVHYKSFHRRRSSNWIEYGWFCSEATPENVSKRTKNVNHLFIQFDTHYRFFTGHPILNLKQYKVHYFFNILDILLH